MGGSNPSRLAMLGTVAAIGSAAAAPAVTAATASRAEWDAAIRHHDETQRAAQASEDLVMVMAHLIGRPDRQEAIKSAIEQRQNGEA